MDQSSQLAVWRDSYKTEMSSDEACCGYNIVFDAKDSTRRKRSVDGAIGSNQDTQNDFAKKFRRLRACARCHRLKMRCVFEDPSFESCTRCFKAGLRCSATDDPTLAQAKSRPRKKKKLKGNDPLAQLQNAVNEVGKLLNSIQRGDSYDTDVVNSESLSTLQLQLTETQRLILRTVSAEKCKQVENFDTSKVEASSINSMKEGPVKSVPSLPWISYDQNIMKQLIKLNILTSEEAKRRMEQFFTELYPYWPCVSFPKYYKYEWLLENEPLLLLSFVTVTCLNNPDLHDTLLYYLEDNLAMRTSISGDISFSFIQIYLVLSLWCSPPRKWGSYKHQMSLLMALNLTLCLDLGNEVYRNGTNILSDDSIERQMIRSYMAVYSCCGSLGLSLPRFKVVSWTPVHERCCQLLLMGESNDADKFLHFYSKLVALGEEIFQFLCPNGFPNVSVRKFNTSIESQDFGSGINNGSLRNIMVGYERRMQQLAKESNLFGPPSKMRNLLSIIYYQLLMTMYDYVVCQVLVRRDVLTEVYLQTLNRLIKASEKVIDSFILLCEQTDSFPTFFYYRPMHALVALIRARLLVKTQQLDFDINVEQEHDKVLAAINKIAVKSKVANKMKAILTRISKWMKVSNKFNKNGATTSMVDLLNELGKEKAIEKIKINLQNNCDSGDNMNMSNNSRIQFMKSFESNAMDDDHMSKIEIENCNMEPESIKMSRLSQNIHKPDTNDEYNLNSKTASNPIFIPSPIGYSVSEVMDTFQSSQNERQTGMAKHNFDYSTSNTSTYAAHTSAKNKKPLLTSLSRKSSLVEGINISIPGDNNEMHPFEGEKPPLSSTLSDALNIPKCLSYSQSALNEVPISQYVENDGASEIQFGQQQQKILNDIFNQIDTDIMGTGREDQTAGLGIPPIFDFLGTCGHHQSKFGSDFPIPDDWYKSL